MHKNIQFGPLETTLLFELEKEEVRIFDFRKAKDILQKSDSSVANVLHRLKKKDRIEEIEKGKYVLSPARSGLEGNWRESTLLVVDSLVDDYYVGFWTAMNYWGMTEQVPQTVLVALTKRKRNIRYGGQEIRFITISKGRFFGEVEEKTDGGTFRISSREKTILDALTYPRHCGGITEAVKAVWNPRDELEWGKLLGFLDRLGISAVNRRLGYILEVLEIKGGLQKEIEEDFSGYRWLDPSARKDTVGYSKRWGLKVNIPRGELLEWREH